LQLKRIDRTQATDSLAAYVANLAGNPVIVTDQGRPVAALVPIENADLETISLSTNRQFLDLVERSRSRVRREGGISSEEMRRRFNSPRQ
jgi:antitoxin (DNA-binding transcriptional repressor) of toxin-antitoxin stability system